MTSYVTKAEGDVILASKLRKEAWEEATETDIDTALLQATEIIDRLNYLGEKTSSAQEHQFPRIDDTEVPEDIEKACVHIALALLDGVDVEEEAATVFMSKQEFGNTRATYDRGSVPVHVLAGVPSLTAWRYLLPYLRRETEFTISRVS